MLKKMESLFALLRLSRADKHKVVLDDLYNSASLALQGAVSEINSMGVEGISAEILETERGRHLVLKVDFADTDGLKVIEFRNLFGQSLIDNQQKLCFDSDNLSNPIRFKTTHCLLEGKEQWNGLGLGLIKAEFGSIPQILLKKKTDINRLTKGGQTVEELSDRNPPDRITNRAHHRILTIEDSGVKL